MGASQHIDRQGLGTATRGDLANSASSAPLLKLYASDEFLPTGVPHVPLLYPFWGMPDGEKDLSVYGRFVSLGRDYFRMVSDRSADFFVLPFDWRYTTRPFSRSEDADRALATAQRCSERAEKLGRRLIVFFASDSDEEVPLPNSVIFRTAMQRGLRSNEFAMAVFFNDFVGQRLRSWIPVRPKLPHPSVGFCGFAGYRLLPGGGPWRKGRSLVRWAYRGFPGLSLRERAITRLRRHPSVVVDLILREHAKGWRPLPQTSLEDFQRNLINTDYNLCVRGGGNWSVRFYETLAFARVPLFVDTECALPYDFEVNYKNYCVWVDSSRVEDIASQLLEFHTKLGATEFRDLQRESRRLWEERLTPEGFFSRFYRHF